MATSSSTANNMSRAKDLAASGCPVTDQMKLLLTKAQQLATEETILSRLVIDQIKKLKEIGEFNAPIISGAEKEEFSASPELEGWLEEVYTAISMADNLLDECEYHVHHHQSLLRRADTQESGAVKKYLSSIILSFAKPINSSLVRPVTSKIGWSKASERLKSVNSGLKRALEERRNNPLPAEAENGHWMRSANFQAMVDVSDIESKLVEERNEVGNIVGELLYSDNDNGLAFIRVVGWAETGTSVLARVIYKNVEVMFHFDDRMWVEVPEDFVLESIAKSMLTTLTRTRVEEDEDIVGSLKERLKGKRYLLVLDGVSELKPSFIEFLQGLGGCRGCKVLITTGSEFKTDSISFSYKMTLNSSEYCSTLFEKISQEEGEISRTELRKTIINKCDGNVLYLKLLGGLMSRMKDESRWSAIIASEEWRTSLFPQLCYSYMSSLPLKRCFQYCCIFPKGYLIQREELIQLWMAQGYVSGPELVDLGLMYYDILLKTGFLQVSEDDDFDKQSCKVPDLLWDAVVSGGCGDGLKTVENGEVRNCSGAVHLSLIRCKVRYSKSLTDGFLQLRTLRLENTTGGLGDFLSNAEALALRVLILVDGTLEELPASIGRLKRLKYLDISRTKVERLPDSISELYNLQTLKLYGLEEPSRNMGDLVSLKNIDIQKDLVSLKIIPGQFRGFVKHAKASLKVFIDKNGKIDDSEWVKIPNRCSSISIHLLENAKPETVRNQTLGFLKKHEIECIKLHWSAGRENSYGEDDVLENLKPHSSMRSLTIENFKGTTFPSWMSKDISFILLHNLVTLELANCSWCEKLPPLGLLGSLTILKIVRMESVYIIAHEFYGGSSSVFLALKVFLLCQMPNLDLWWGEKSTLTDAFPSLVRFEVEECDKLSAIPDVLLQACLVRKLRIAHCKQLAALPANIGELSSLADLELFGLPSLQAVITIGGAAANLRSLMIGCIGPENHFPGRLEHLSTLRSLTVWGYGEKHLPEWIADLPSLKILKLEFSETLESFPSAETMQKLTSLKELNISSCPLLEESCIRGSRQEWKKVSKLSTNPVIVVDNDTIQLRRPMQDTFEY